jgi:hypothetical protein
LIFHADGYSNVRSPSVVVYFVQPAVVGADVAGAAAVVVAVAVGEGTAEVVAVVGLVVEGAPGVAGCPQPPSKRARHREPEARKTGVAERYIGISWSGMRPRMVHQFWPSRETEGRN